MAKRVFVFFGSHRQLAKLREHGYKTFDPVIDESYDDVENDVERWDMAFKQMMILMQKDPITVYDSLETVLKHNYGMVYDQSNRLLKLQTWINTSINKREKH